jgi:hypothetical protein
MNAPRALVKRYGENGAPAANWCPEVGERALWAKASAYVEHARATKRLLLSPWKRNPTALTSQMNRRVLALAWDPRAIRIVSYTREAERVAVQAALDEGWSIMYVDHNGDIIGGEQ